MLAKATGFIIPFPLPPLSTHAHYSPASMSDEYVAMHSYTTDGSSSPAGQSSYLPLDKTGSPTTTATVVVHGPPSPLEPDKGLYRNQYTCTNSIYGT